eukprot:scpid22510/ scgid22511/ 
MQSHQTKDTCIKLHAGPDTTQYHSRCQESALSALKGVAEPCFTHDRPRVGTDRRTSSHSSPVNVATLDVSEAFPSLGLALALSSLPDAAAGSELAIILALASSSKAPSINDTGNACTSTSSSISPPLEERPTVASESNKRLLQY